MTTLPGLIGLMLLVGAPGAAVTAEAARSPYAGQESRAIKSLSDDDIAELGRGGGWGMAKTAELNGVPGPSHLLELAAEVHLSDDQIARIEAIRDAMRAKAIRHGNRLIALEGELDKGFREGTLSDSELREFLEDIAAERLELRYAHLVAHLQARPLLTDEQIAQYNQLRGYSADPCATVPEGHDPKQWRMHNPC